MPDKKIVLSEQTARELARVMRWARRQMRINGSLPIKTKRGRGYVAVLRYKLTEDLEYRDSANATLTRQDRDGAWTDGTSPDDDAEIWDTILQSGKKLASDGYVLVYRNPDSGKLCLLNSQDCPEDA